VETLASLVHEQNRAGVMVTHDLRLVQYTDRVIQLLDGRVERIISPQEDLACLADPAECAMIPMEVLAIGDSRE
jgi:putative ABC transport system ATP-binding protein